MGVPFDLRHVDLSPSRVLNRAPLVRALGNENGEASLASPFFVDLLFR
jgi:hypothetical protein